MGEIPEWYRLICAAKYLGVAPWDLHSQPVIWQSWADMAERAENSAAAQKRASATRKGQIG